MNIFIQFVSGEESIVEIWNHFRGGGGGVFILFLKNMNFGARMNVPILIEIQVFPSINVTLYVFM